MRDKNTSDPEAYNNPKEEGAGAVASDSLAADSSRAGGAFSENRNSEPLKQSGSSSTFNNTDTSSATTLPPAANSQEREGDDPQKYPEGLGGQGSFPGQHNADGYVGGSTRAKEEMSSSGAYRTSTQGRLGEGESEQGESGTSGGADEAPGYVGSNYSEPTQTGKPKGKNLTEGGFDADDSKNASYTTDIGGEDDPGRAAVQGIRAGKSAAIGTGPRHQGDASEGGQYEALETDQTI